MRAAILGNGPSLAGFDFQKELEGIDTFGMNAAYRYWDQIGWYPDYYSCLDMVVGLSHQEEIRRLIENAETYGIKKFLLRANLIQALGAVKNSDRLLNFDSMRARDWLFSGVFITTGSHTCAWAVHLGYKNIAVLGVDCNYVEHVPGSEVKEGHVLEIKEDKDNPNYFFAGYQQKGDLYNVPNHNPAVPTHINSWRELRHLVDRTDAVVVSANPKTMVDAFPICAFSDLEAKWAKERQFKLLLKAEKARDILKTTTCFERQERTRFDETYFLHELVQHRRGVMIDVGAHIGSSSLPFLRSGWKTYGFEPDPNNRARLTRNLRGFPSFVCDSRAVSEVSGQTVSFYTSEESTGISSLHPFTDGHEETVRVTTVSLRDFCVERSIESVDILKVDAEGMDLMVLKSFPWESMQPHVVMAEFEDKKTIGLGYDMHDMANFLQEKGYTVYVSEWFPVKRYGISHDWRCFRPYPYEPAATAWGNLIAFRERPDEAALLEVLKKHLARNPEEPKAPVRRAAIRKAPPRTAPVAEEPQYRQIATATGATSLRLS